MSKPTIRDILLRKGISKAVVKRSKTLDKLTQEIMEERKNRVKKGKRTEKEKKLIREALRIGRSPSESGVKTIGSYHAEPTNRLGKNG